MKLPSDSSSNVGRNRTKNVGRDLALFGASELVIQSGMAMRLIGTEGIVIKGGRAGTTMKKNGDIDIKGRDVSVTVTGTLTLKGARIVN